MKFAVKRCAIVSLLFQAVLIVSTNAQELADKNKNNEPPTTAKQKDVNGEEIDPDNGVWMRQGGGGVAVRAGEDALLSCVVRGARPVLWRRARDSAVLAAGAVRVAPDSRIQVLHDDDEEPAAGAAGIPRGGDVWALVIRAVRPADAGLYVCEINSVPPVRSFHKLTVISRGLTPPEGLNGTQDTYSANGPPLSGSALAHNYTDCCQAANVSGACLGFCSIQTILEGTGTDPENCQPDFPAIVRCMADGRNHVPCCIQERVPDICQDVCRGEFTPITDNIKTHYSCASYMEKTLACIVEGIELLPSPPENIEVETLSEKQLKVSWSIPISNAEYITEYQVNVTTLRSFDAHLIDPAESASNRSQEETSMNTKVIKVPATKNSTIVNDLLPFTMYEITVTSFNIHGSSLPSYAVRSLTLTPGKMRPTGVAAAPVLPDVRQCCLDAGISHFGCVDKLCDPKRTLEIELQVTDLMICAPWAAATFRCLADGMDHSPCCRARGLPETCLPLCAGNITSIDFNSFKCIRHMSSYTNCLLQGYGVLPGAPARLHLTNIAPDYAVVHWAPPATLADTVQYYNLHYRMLEGDDASSYELIDQINSPFILENLESNTDYEVYVEAVNEHGVGEASPRLIFRTQSQVLEDIIEEANAYNMTACCEHASLASICMPLCTYDAKMSDLRALAPICAQDFHKLLRCGAGGRNHESCCMRRGVPASCKPLCSGVMVGSMLFTVNTCIPYIGNIVQCFEEGTGILPGPPREVHAMRVANDEILLQWTPPTDGTNATAYTVFFKKIDNATAPYYYNSLKLEKQINVTDTSVIVKGLVRDSTYHMFVVAINDNGTSLPSSIIVLNTTKDDKSSDIVKGVVSPPHSLSVSGHSATWVTISWQPPQFSHPEEKISYTLFYKSTGTGDFTTITTTVPSHNLDKLSPNTQYIIYVTASTPDGVSAPSETLVAWTDPAYPAFVEPPTVNPVNLVVEGSSMTVLCIAMGTPTPTISLYISGRLVHQDITRHMVTVIHNVTRDMDQISCYADNGYGTPMQASRKITISHVPAIQASGIIMAAAGDSVTLECRVEALPKPQIAFWKDPQGRVPVIEGPRYTIQLIQDSEEKTKYTMRLTIKHITEADEGDYFCHAENAFGAAVRPVSVRLRTAVPQHNMTQCCTQLKVSSACIDVCSFYLDMDNIIDRPECVADFDKLMKCAADGSDHRICCASWGVPRSCLELCRGGAVSRSCALHHAKRALACFREGGAQLPGPPRQLRVDTVTQSHSVMLSWEPPTKNPETVEMYRVFWRPLGVKTPDKLDTAESKVVISGLQDGVTYECVVKATNKYGTSTLTGPVQFTAEGASTSAAAAPVGEGASAGAIVGGALAFLAVAAILVAAVLFVRHKRGLRLKSQGGVAFENPSYLREPNPDMANGGITAIDGSTRSNGVPPNAISNSSAWRQESMSTTSPQEVNPTLYEELKLGQDGAGFKRLKP